MMRDIFWHAVSVLLLVILGAEVYVLVRLAFDLSVWGTLE
jgi:hypothetical protein